MEFGPRALSTRSILADPRRVDTQTRLNLKVSSASPSAVRACRPVGRAASISSSTAPARMLMTAMVRPGGACPWTASPSTSGNDDLLALVRQVRSDVPAITHVDYSARIQTVGPDGNPEFRAIIQGFRDLTGCPMVVNTSFNVRGEPIVCTPQDAWSCFRRTDIDVLVVEDLIITSKPPRVHGSADRPHDGTAPSDPPVLENARTDLFFSLILTPLAERCAADFARRLGDEHPTGSAYCVPEAGAEFFELETLDAIGDLLRRRWTALGLDAACGLTQPLMELAEELIDAWKTRTSAT